VDAAPVIARGHSLAILVPPVPAAAAPYLEAIPEHRPTLVVTADADRAQALAESCPGRTSLAVSGLARAQRRLTERLPDLLFVSAIDALQLLKRSALKALEFQTIVVAWPEQLDQEGREALGALMAETDRDSQRMVLTATPGPALEELLQRYAFKAVTFGFPPAEPGGAPPATVGPASYVIARPTQLEAMRRRILDALDPERDEEVTIAPCPPSREAAEALGRQVAAAGTAARLIFVVEPVEVAWLRTLFSPLTPVRLPTSLDALEHRAETVRARLVRTLETENLDRELFLLGPLLERFDPSEVAAAALRLAGTDALAQTAERAGSPRAAEAARVGGGGGGTLGVGAGVPSWTKLWVGVGRKDNVRPGDVLGAIVGEAKLAADHVGKIDVRELFCLVEVQPEDAERVVRALTGTTLRGRRLTARVDRGHAPPRPGGPHHGRQPGSPDRP
jgi:hypothetical protein